MLDLVRNPKDRFSRIAALIIKLISTDNDTSSIINHHNIVTKLLELLSRGSSPKSQRLPGNFSHSLKQLSL